jgi:hypothetical protein
LKILKIFKSPKGIASSVGFNYKFGFQAFKTFTVPLLLTLKSSSIKTNAINLI